jgi:hypothetical protein
MRSTIRASVIRQPNPYMWVQLAESPLGLGSLYVCNPFQRKGKVGIYGKGGGKPGSSVLKRHLKARRGNQDRRLSTNRNMKTERKARQI